MAGCFLALAAEGVRQGVEVSMVFRSMPMIFSGICQYTIALYCRCYGTATAGDNILWVAIHSISWLYLPHRISRYLQADMTEVSHATTVTMIISVDSPTVRALERWWQVRAMAQRKKSLCVAPSAWKLQGGLPRHRSCEQQL